MTTINERTSCTVEFDLVDQSSQAVPAASLTSLVLTLYNLPPYGGAVTYINNRHGQNALNANSVTVDSAGHVVWTYQVADGAIVDDTQVSETHIALFAATWAGGALGMTYEVPFLVKNIQTTP